MKLFIQSLKDIALGACSILILIKLCPLLNTFFFIFNYKENRFYFNFVFIYIFFPKLMKTFFYVFFLFILFQVLLIDKHGFLGFSQK